MKDFVLKYIDEKPLIGNLIFNINSSIVPYWFVQIVRHLALHYPADRIIIVSNDRQETHKGRPKAYTFLPLLWVEKYFFRQKLIAFNKVNVHSAFDDLKMVEVKESFGDVKSEEWLTDNATVIDFNNLQIDNDNVNVFRYPIRLLKCGSEGIVYFVRRYLCMREPLLIQSGNVFVWKHLFQTLAYSIDKNSNFFKGAVKQSIESLWRTDKKVDCGQDYAKNDNCTNASLLQYWFRWSVVRVLKYIKKFCYNRRWIVIYQDDNDKLNKLFPLGNDGWADPFIVDDQYLFVEQIDARTGKGNLQVVTIDHQGRTSNQTKIIDETFHLSYPNVIKYGDQWLMIPESAESMGLRLYASNSFPHTWKFVRELQSNVQFLDFTPFFHRKLWWMFTIVKSMKDGGSYDQLFLFYSSDILNREWMPHRQNPIITDSSLARPAGKLFFKNNELFRPSQDCFNEYGGRIRINKITVLTENEFKEEFVEYIDSSTLGIKAMGVHTINRANNFTVYDAQIWTSKF